MKLADVPKCPLLFVVGSTASGKSELALQLAEKYQGLIVNCDSVQFYDKLKIGSASPSVQDLSRVPHYLYNYVSCPQEMTAGQFLRDFYQLLKKENFKILKAGIGPVGKGDFILGLLGRFEIDAFHFEHREVTLAFLGRTDLAGNSISGP